MTQEAATQAAGSLLKKQQRQQVAIQSSPETRFPRLHIGEWGPGKMGKSHLALSARTSRVFLQQVADFKSVEVETLMPSKPLPVAYANFDREAHTVYANLPADADIIEEKFFLDGNGQPIIAPDEVMLAGIVQRFKEFLADSIADGRELVFVDGGTIVWQDVRFAKVEGAAAPAGKTADGEARHLPRQYGPANATMRHEIMRPLYSANAHTVITREAGERWASQNESVKDPGEVGGVALRPDGWNKTAHLIDLDVQMRTYPNAEGRVIRQALIPQTAIKASMLGKTIADPTFAKLYGLTFGVPLLLRADIPEFMRLEEEHRGKEGLSIAWD